MKKRITAAPTPPARRRGRPPGQAPAKSNRERQEAYRERRKQEGKRPLHLWLEPSVIEQFDSLRADDATREETFERLVSDAASNKT